MQAQVTLTGDVKSIAAVMAALAGSGGDTAVSGELGVVTPPKKRGRKSKAELEAMAAAEADPVDEETEEDEADEETEEDEADEETEEDEADEEEAPPPAKKKVAKLTLDGDIVPAFQAYAKKHSREKAAKVLAKFKAKSCRDLPPAKFPEVLKMLKV